MKIHFDPFLHNYIEFSKFQTIPYTTYTNSYLLTTNYIASKQMLTRFHLHFTSAGEKCVSPISCFTLCT